MLLLIRSESRNSSKKNLLSYIEQQCFVENEFIELNIKEVDILFELFDF